MDIAVNFREKPLANIAVLIGNTDYKLLNKLECCSADVQAMQELLAATGRFDGIEVILNSDSAHLKERIRAVIDAHKSISEIFFYYTGHGFMRGASSTIAPRILTTSGQMRPDWTTPSPFVVRYCAPQV